MSVSRAVLGLALLTLVCGECDHLSRHFYKELGCKPIYTSDQQCPAKYDCGNLEQNRLNHCVAKDVLYEKDDRISFGQGISNPCVPDCYCYQTNHMVTRYQWRCTHNDCPQHFEPSLPRGCFWQEDLKRCCPNKKVCKTHRETCTYNGRKYKENDKFYTFRDSSCMKCICGDSFNGTVSEPWCAEVGCDLEIHVSEELARGCAPVYSRHFCCPIDWRCPDPEDTISPPEVKKLPIKKEGQCKFGNLLLNIGDSVLPDLEASCRCNIPPYVVCTST